MAVISLAKIQIVIPPPQICVKCNTQFLVFNARQSHAVVGNKNFGFRLVCFEEPVDLPANLILLLRRCLARQIADRLGAGQHDPPLIDHMVKLLFDFHKDFFIICRDPVTTKPQLFLIDRFLQRGSNQFKIVRIIIDVADGIASVLICLHVGCHAVKQSVIPGGIQKIFFLKPLEALLDLFRHGTASFAVSGPILRFHPKTNLKITGK